MPEFVKLTHAPTREEHDAVVARKGRPYTDTGMRAVRLDDADIPANLSLVDQVIADSRRSEQ